MAQNDTSNDIPLSAYVVRVTDLMARLDWFEDLLSNAYHQCYCMEDYDKADEYVYEMRAIRKFRADLVVAHAPNSKLYDDAEMMTNMPDFVQHDDGHWHPSYVDEI